MTKKYRLQRANAAIMTLSEFLRFIRDGKFPCKFKYSETKDEHMTKLNALHAAMKDLYPGDDPGSGTHLLGLLESAIFACRQAAEKQEGK